MTPTFGWDASEADRLAEVNHVDGRRRPWRSAGVALAAFALGAVMVPHPIDAAGVGAIAIGTLVAAVAAWRFPILRGHRQPDLADLAVGVDTEGVVVARGGLHRRLAPEAIDRLVVGSDHVFLHLAEGELVTIPCRVFPARGALDRFVDAVEQFRRRGAAPTDGPEPGLDRWSLAYGLHTTGIGRSHDRVGDRERLLLIGFAVGSFGVLLGSTEPWRGGLDLVLLALFGAIGVVFVVAGRRPRAPVGPVTLTLGPEGGWMRTEGGTARFGWRSVRGVDRAPDGLVLRFVEQVIPIPEVAIPADRERFVADLEAWWQTARTVSPGGPSDAPVPEDGARPVTDPFAPPR